jgi:hypothetical protein
VDDPPGVSRGETARRLRGERERFGGGNPAVLQTVAERAALQQLGDDERSAVVRTDVEDGDHVRVGEGRRSARLAREPLQPLGVRGEAVRQDLQRDLTPEPGVAGAVDLANAAGSEPGHDLVGADPRSHRQHDCVP